MTTHPDTIETLEQRAALSEHEAAVLGVPGRMHQKHARENGTWINQTWRSFGRPIAGYGSGAMLSVKIRFDDSCKNGHDSFAITAEVRRPKARDIEAGGCLHDDIAKVFPELQPLIKWHLTSTDGPMHYLANTVYHAANRDCHGLHKGESRQLRNGKTGEPAWHLVAVNDLGEETEIHQIEKYRDGFDQPKHRYTLEYRPWCRIGEGKARELDHARSAAVWPEATDAELSIEPDELRKVLAARLPALLADFRAAMEGAGLLWPVIDAPSGATAKQEG
jgi:hypothetical protein